MKTYIKLLFRTLKKEFTRILIIASIITVGVGLSTGLGSLPSQLSDSYETYYEKHNFADVIIKSTSTSGIDQDTIDTVNGLDFVTSTEKTIEIDDENGIRVIYSNISELQVNKIELIEGRLPKKALEIVVEESTNYIKSYQLYDVITYQGQKMTIVGIVRNPMLIYKEGVASLINPDVFLNTVIYMDTKYQNLPITTDLYIDFKVKDKPFTEDYTHSVANYVDQLKESIDTTQIVILTREEMLTNVVIDLNIGKMETISLIFPIFFTIVIIIVSLTTMTRLVEDDRAIAGTFRSLGFNGVKITFRYYVIAIIAGILGAMFGITLGYETLAVLIYDAFDTIMKMPPLTNNIHVTFGMIIAGILLISMLITISVISLNVFKEKPAELLRQKSPKPGSKIFLEKVPFIWKRLKFKYKSSLRNIFRYPTHFFMTIFSISGATVLVFAGFGLLDNTSVLKNEGSGSIELIALIVLIAAAALSILVTFNLTNMNIEERKREIATLKVLGYNKKEVAGYIFREVFIISLIGIIIGFPLGYLFLDFALEYIDFGSVENLTLQTWIITPIISIIFIALTDVLLYSKINKVDMNASLKSIE